MAGERHAGLPGWGWWEPTNTQLTKPSEGFGSGGGSRRLSPLRQPDSAPSVPRWLNTLGLLASQGIDVVVRHSFLDHGHNHLVDQNFNPLPVGLPRGRHTGSGYSLLILGGILSLWPV